MSRYGHSFCVEVWVLRTTVRNQTNINIYKYIYIYIYNYEMEDAVFRLSEMLRGVKRHTTGILST
jgi:hypothetical protein